MKVPFQNAFAFGCLIGLGALAIDLVEKSGLVSDGNAIMLLLLLMAVSIERAIWLRSLFNPTKTKPPKISKRRP